MAADDGRNSGGHAREGQDDDAVWADLVARLEAMDDDGRPDGAPRADGRTERGDAGKRPGFAAFDPLGLSGADALPPAAGRGPRDYAPDPEAEEDLDAFVPEDPQVFSGADPRMVLAWAGAAGVPLLLVAFLIFWRSAPTPLWWLLVLSFVSGVAYLFWRLPRGTQDDYDDGAQL